MLRKLLSPGGVISLIIVGLFAYVQYTLLHMAEALPESTLALLQRSLGMLDAALGAVLFYWVGSSDGSKTKTELLGQQSKSPIPNTDMKQEKSDA